MNEQAIKIAGLITLGVFLIAYFTSYQITTDPKFCYNKIHNETKTWLNECLKAQKWEPSFLLLLVPIVNFPICYFVVRNFITKMDRQRGSNYGR